MNTQHIIRNGKRFFAPTLAATIAVALAFISCSELKEVEFFTPEERAAIMARGSSSSSSEESSSSVLKECEASPGKDQFCYDGLLHNRCGGTDGITYIPTTQICNGTSAIPARCNGIAYNPIENKCEGNTLKNRCGIGREYHYSQDDYEWYDPSTQFCFSNRIYDKCGGDDYDPATHFCDVREGGKVYKWVKIDKQVWMAENLNYDVSGSKCYDNESANCEKYGRLYNWSTAMDIDTKYNDEKWGNDVKHQGICPAGWHIPSNEEWKTLISYVESDKGCSSCAGVYLKSTNGWDNCGASGSGKTYLCEDAHSFFALPSGAYSSDSFRYAGIGGRWWSASEFSYSNVSAYCQEMYNNFDFASKNSTGVKSNLFSVRCVKD